MLGISEMFLTEEAIKYQWTEDSRSEYFYEYYLPRQFKFCYPSNTFWSSLKRSWPAIKHSTNNSWHSAILKSTSFWHRAWAWAVPWWPQWGGNIFKPHGNKDTVFIPSAPSEYSKHFLPTRYFWLPPASCFINVMQALLAPRTSIFLILKPNTPNEYSRNPATSGTSPLAVDDFADNIHAAWLTIAMSQ